MFNVGQQVNHSLFGKGVITEIRERTWLGNVPDLPIVVVEFETPMLTELDAKQYNPVPKTTRVFNEASLREFLVA